MQKVCSEQASFSEYFLEVFVVAAVIKLTVFVVDEIVTSFSVVESVLTDIEVIEVDILVDAKGAALIEVTASVEVDFSVVDVFAESCIEAVIDDVVDAGKAFPVIDVVGRLVNLGDDIETDGDTLPA